MKSDKLVLLFYDGYERRAEAFLPGRIKAEARRHARFVWRTLRHKQVRSGYYTDLMHLCLALRRAGVPYRINDFEAAKHAPAHPIGLIGYPTVFDKVACLPNPRLMGPGLYTSPSENPGLFSDPRNRIYIERCEWVKNLFAPFYGEHHLRPWFRGFDLADFEDTRVLPKTIDVLVYDKIYHDREANYPRTIGPFIRRLQEQGLTYRVIRYGAYAHQDYVRLLRASRSLAFFSHSETQGHAYQEAMAMNVPVFAWDEGVWLDPVARKLSPDAPVKATSTPHFDSRCGVRFRAGGMSEAWERFWPMRSQFLPRDYVAEALSLRRSAELYLDAYGAAAYARPYPTARSFSQKKVGGAYRSLPPSSRQEPGTSS